MNFKDPKIIAIIVAIVLVAIAYSLRFIQPKDAQGNVDTARVDKMKLASKIIAGLVVVPLAYSGYLYYKENKAVSAQRSLASELASPKMF